MFYLVSAPTLCFKNYTLLEDFSFFKKGTLQQLLKMILTNIYM